MFDSNKRRYPRANYPCQLTIWVDNEPYETLLANTSNIGIGGLCVHLNQEINVGYKVDIQLQFTDTTTPFRCHGAVVRCVEEGERSYSVAVQFEPLPELKLAFLDGKISEIIALENKGNK